MEPIVELSRLVARHAALAPGRAWTNNSLGLTFGIASKLSGPMHRVYQPAFALVVQGEKQLVIGDEIFTCGKGTFILVSVDLPLTVQISRATPALPYMALALTLNGARDLRCAGYARTIARPCRSKSWRASRP